MPAMLNKRNPVHKMQKMIARRNSRSKDDDTTDKPLWRRDGQWEVRRARLVVSPQGIRFCGLWPSFRAFVAPFVGMWG
jgi:hypothetical protein